MSSIPRFRDGGTFYKMDPSQPFPPQVLTKYNEHSEPLGFSFEDIKYSN